MRLRQSAGNFFSGDSSMSCGSTSVNFTFGRCIYSVDMEKCGNMALLSGVSTKGGETVTMEMRGVTGITAGDFMIIYQVCDVVASLRMGAVDVLD